MITSRVYPNMLSTHEVQSINDFYSTQLVVNTETDIENKNLEYHIPENYIYQVLHPKLCEIFGEDHVFDTGAYKSSRRPYIIHVDSHLQHNAYSHCMTFGTGVKKHNKAVLIPLVEGDQFRTVTFAAWSDYNPTVKDMLQKAGEPNYLLEEDFDHDPNFKYIKNLEIDTDYHWHLGDILVWDRSQWHMSSNFWKQGKEKTFLVLFIE